MSEACGAGSRGTRARVATATLLTVLAVLAGLLTACTSDGSPSSTPPTRAAIATLLADHGAAVRAGDEKAFLAGLAPGAYRDRQRVVYANLRRLPLTHWTYTLGPRVDDAIAQKQARTKRGGSAVIVRVTLGYALRGVDVVPTEQTLWLTVVSRDGRPVLTADSDLATDGGRSWRGPWDFGPIGVATAPAAIVIAHPADADLARTLLREVTAAVPVVTGVVGRDWTRRVAVLVPATTAERDAALGPVAAGSVEVGAIATNDGEDPASGQVLGQRVVVAPDELRRLTDRGVGVVLRHEITHVAVAGQTTGATPRWLAEGFAEYVGQLGSGQTAAATALELRDQVRRSGVPRGLPGEAAFDSASTVAAAYQQAWLACREIAARQGQAALVRFYRAVGASSDTSDEAVAAALRRVLGETPAQFLARWRAYVTDQLT